MKKTRKEKLAAAVRRQKEFERVGQVLSGKVKFTQQKDLFEKIEGSVQSPNTSLPNLLQNLTNLSYLPKQLVKIGVVTGVLILVQLLLYFLIL